MAEPTTTALRADTASPTDNAPANITAETSTPTPTSSTSPSVAGDSGENPATAATDIKNEDPASNTNTETISPSTAAVASKKRYCTHRKQSLMEAEKEKAEKEKAEKAGSKEKEKEADKDSEKEKDKEKTENLTSTADGKQKKKKKAAKKSKKKSHSRRRSEDTESEDESDSESDSESSSSDSSSSESSSDESDSDQELVMAMMKFMLKNKIKAKASKKKRKARNKRKRKAERDSDSDDSEDDDGKDGEKTEEEKKMSLEYKRVDELYDKDAHEWTIKDTVTEIKVDNYSEYVFTVRRCFDYEGRYTGTVLDIKSPLLKDALNDVLGNVRGVSLVEDIPVIDPKVIFNHEKEIREWLDTDHSKKESKKVRRDPLTQQPLPQFTDEDLKLQKEQVKKLLEYIDTDFKAVRAQLYPLLESKCITYDLLWAILKPNTIMYTTCSGSKEPRAFRLEYAEENCSFTRGKWWSVEGRYLEFEGEQEKEAQKSPTAGFGWGTVIVDIDSFKGPTKIQSLACYPMEMRKDCAELREKLIARGKKFVELRGQQYKMHNGLAFMKKNRQYLKIHVNGRVMVDSATFRRINPNYSISSVKSRGETEEEEEANYFYLNPDDDPANEEACEDCSCSNSKDNDDEERELKKVRWIKDDEGDWHLVTKEEILSGKNKLDTNIKGANEEAQEPTFDDEDYLLASPVVLGWAFNEKLWLEFPVAQISDIVWNDKAFDCLVLPNDQKDIVRALVESHSATTGSSTIDDVIAGKGRGLVSVLHGPPGVGKTMTCEAIAEFLRRPLYCVSSGELGTNASQLEHELQKILDIAQSWGAVLLLDEADVFLEKRSFADMHRNALVSIFLRLLEYFQGILFLTTNRVETFDDAFQSRIHVALHYGHLKQDAKISIWKMFLDKVYDAEKDASPDSDIKPLVTAEDIQWLSRKELNGRQIKNLVRTAQALAKSKGERMDFRHLKKVLSVSESFDNDLRGTGRLDNMHAYA